MKIRDVSRRAVLQTAGQVSLVTTAALAVTGCGDGESLIVCADPNKMSVSENSIRKANNYVEKSPHADKNCAGCGFMHPVPEGESCAKCEIYLGPVNPAGYCDSYSAREA